MRVWFWQFALFAAVFAISNVLWHGALKGDWGYGIGRAVSEIITILGLWCALKINDRLNA